MYFIINTEQKNWGIWTFDTGSFLGVKAPLEPGLVRDSNFSKVTRDMFGTFKGSVRDMYGTCKGHVRGI